MRLSLRALAATAAVASGFLAVSAAPVSAFCLPVQSEWHVIYDGDFGHVRVPMPTKIGECPPPKTV